MQSFPPIEPVLALIRDAGALVRRMQPQISLGIKQDGSVVTEADISAHHMILERLKQLTPDVPVISEEQSEAENLRILQDSHVCWVVDPLDVTAHYAAGGNGYSINIALMEDGIPLLGALYFPALEELYFTGDDHQAYKQIGQGNAEPIQTVLKTAGGATAAVRPNATATHTPINERTLKLVFTRGQRRACLVACGEATFCSEREGFRIWDSAATYAIVHAAGGALQKEDGSELRYNQTLELPAYFVAHPDVLGNLCAVDDHSHPKRKNA